MKVAIAALGQNPRMPTGLLSYFGQLARFLPQVDRGSDYHFAVTRSSAPVIGDGADSVMDEFWPDSQSRYGRLLSEHFFLGPWLHLKRFDVLFIANAGTRPLLLPSSVRLVQGIFGFHQFETGQINGLTSLYRKLLFGATLKRADFIVLNSHYSKTLLDRHAKVDPDRVRIISHGHNDKLFHAGPETEAEKQIAETLCLPPRYVAIVSQMYPYKNIETAVEGYCRFIKRTGAPHDLVLVGQFSRSFGDGEAYRQRLIATAAAHGFERRLHFHANVPVKALRCLYLRAEAYIQPSTSETFGRTTVEAMACGCPVVAARAAATPEVLGKAGLYFESQDADACATWLEQFALHPALRADYVARGIARAHYFSFAEEARRLAAVFKEAASLG